MSLILKSGWNRPVGICLPTENELGLHHKYRVPQLNTLQRVRPPRMNRTLRFLSSDDGATAVEYAVLLAGIIGVLIAGITLVGGETLNFWQNNGTELDTALQNAAGGS